MGQHTFYCLKVKKFSKHWVCQRLPATQELTIALQKSMQCTKIYKILSDQGCSEDNPLGVDSSPTDVKLPLCKPAGDLPPAVQLQLSPADLRRALDSCAQLDILQQPSQWATICGLTTLGILICNILKAFPIHLRIQNKIFYQNGKFGNELVECQHPQ